MTVSDHEPIVWRVQVGLVSGTVAARQPPKRHPEVLADERVYEGVDGRINPTCESATKIELSMKNIKRKKKKTLYKSHIIQDVPRGFTHCDIT